MSRIVRAELEIPNPVNLLNRLNGEYAIARSASLCLPSDQFDDFFD
jgi:hypothetical protein